MYIYTLKEKANLAQIICNRSFALYILSCISHINVGLNDFIMKLDERYSSRQKGECIMAMAKKPRINGLPSTCSVPPDAPSWAVDKEYTCNSISD